LSQFRLPLISSATPRGSRKMKLSKLATGLLRNSAPTLLAALALPPPFNVIASSVAAAALDQFAPEADTGAASAASDASASGRPKIDPPALEKIIEANSKDPDFAVALRQAEIELQRYEVEAGIRFQEIELEDRKRAGAHQVASGIEKEVFQSGMTIVWIAMGGLLLLTIGLLVVISGQWAPAPDQMDLTVAAFGVIGTAVGFVNGLATNVVSFYWGSSQGSKDKSDAISLSMRELGGQLSKATGQAEALRIQEAGRSQQPPIESRAPQPEGGRQSLAAKSPPPPKDTTATAAGFGISEILDALTQPHRQFPESVTWALVEDGISVEGAPAAKTNGEPKTVRRIWDQYGQHCQEWARSYRVPVELIVATIATETNGKRDARRFEPTLNEESVGLMQTLVSTARWALGRDSIRGDDLVDPSLSIEAGTSYIAVQRNETSFDPPLVAAAYNAGSIRKEVSEGNKWRLVCYPKNTGRHVTKLVEWFGDAMRVSAEQDWSDKGSVPSFASAMLGGGSLGTQEASTDQGGAVQTLSSPLLELWSGSIALSELRDKSSLTKEIQRALMFQGYLDPPPDGQFGSVSTWGLKQHCEVCKIPFANSLDEAVANSLIAPLEELPDWTTSGHWFDNVVQYMLNQGYWYCRVPEAKNIVYLEGVNPDGALNEDEPNAFNDLRCVFWLDKDGKGHLKTWEATTEPGRKYTKAPLNDKGAARIKFGQYKAWRLGMHKNDHEALRQVKPLPMYRDKNQDFKRTGDKLDIGLFGINQHWGYDLNRADIGGASAGCLVGRTKEGHKEFMALIKTDPRFLVRENYTFMSTILPGDEIPS